MSSDKIQANCDYHVGHFFMEYMRKDPDDICQIDGATGEQETRRSVLSRSIRLAQCFRNMGLQPGDVLVLGGRNHLDGHTLFYAALLTGLPVAGVDPQFKYNEIKVLFKITEPKIAFCQHEMYEDYRRAAEDLGMATKIVTFDYGDCTMAKFMETYQDDEPEDQFKVAEFDVTKVCCWLVSTSGSSGFPKVVALSHKNVLGNMSFFRFTPKEQGERKIAMSLSSMQWVSACYNILSMPINHIKLITSAPTTSSHVIDLINTYRPVTTFTTATALAPILHHEKHCDLTCFDVIKLGGSKIRIEFLDALRNRVRKDTKIIQGYGLTEIGGTVLVSSPDGPFGNLGEPTENYEVKLVDPDTGRTITENNVIGELWVKGPRMMYYYNNPIATAEAFSEDEYLKTGDLFYRDDNGYYFFVDRQKMLLKYKNYQVIPPEIEDVIMTHEGVEEVCVTGVPHPDDGEHVAACVVRKQGSKVTAQKIKDLVASQLSSPKHLHGGVVFVQEIPLTSTGKIARRKVQELVLNSSRE